MQSLGQLADEFYEARETGGLVLRPEEVLDCVVRAARVYAAHGSISSIDQHDNLPAAGDPEPDEDPVLLPAYPVKNLSLIGEETVVTVGEWAVISPLFNLYIEKENAVRLEASRVAGMEVYGRTVSEINPDITLMENETLPQRAFAQSITTVM